MTPGDDSRVRWRIFVDTGGTFTDCLAIDPRGVTRRAKVLSSGCVRARVVEVWPPRMLRLAADWAAHPEFALGASLRQGAERRSPGAGSTILAIDAGGLVIVSALPAGLEPGSLVEITTGEEAPVLAARLVTGTPAGKALPPMELRLATTRGTNALLERRGAATAFFVTEGFADLLRIGDQTRPELFDLRARRPDPLHSRVVEVHERLDAAGRVLEPVELDRLRADAHAALDAGCRVAAVTLMHAWINPAHERAVGDLLRGIGFDHVSISGDLDPSIGFLARAQTTVVNAFLAPIIDDYLDGVQRPLGEGSTLLVMTSGGGLVDRSAFRPKDSLLSGPAGGVVGAGEAGRRAGCPRVISFDMGGTSTDCARCEGLPELVYRTRVGDASILSPSVAVETVAAGGGSICVVRGNQLRVGPESAGADPGPACYARSGPLTITDCNLLLGRIDPDRFALPLDRAAAEHAAELILREARHAIDPQLSLEQLLAGFIDLANQRMSEAIRRITIRRGHDPAEHALVAFGGAGPQHACAIADALAIDRVVVPPDAGLLSAWGLSVSAPERVAQRQILRPLAEVAGDLPEFLASLDAEAASALGRSHGKAAPIVAHPRAEIRFLGQTETLEIDASDPMTLEDRFRAQYQAAFEQEPLGLGLELVCLRVTARLAASRVEEACTEGRPEAARAAPSPRASRSLFAPGRGWRGVPVYDRAALAPGHEIEGPALIAESHSTTVVERGWTVRAGPHGELGLDRAAAIARPARAPSIEAELAAGKLVAIAEEMGERLRRAAISVNVKERRDYSCAILDPDGLLVVNAPHVPVHLGSLGVCVRALRDALGADLGHAAGGSVITNHPAFGGSHLPDVTVAHAVIDARGQLLGYTACRAHHAEIGGIAPGSMAPEATRLVQEGVVIPPTPLGPRGHADWVRVRGLFQSGPFPSRSPETNLRDLQAALHAAWHGARALESLAERAGGAAHLRTASDLLLTRAETRLRAALAALPPGTRSHAERLDDGTTIRATIHVEGDHADIDFAGSGAVHARCLNATPAIVTSAVVYCLRLLIDEQLPLNEGLLRPITLRIPKGLLNPDFPADASLAPAVAGGNVEISQVIVESVLTGLELCAQSQGTMNNVVFGNESFGFYETLCGGCGACEDFPGASVTHSHMTNTALTDAEILEFRYPVRLERSAVRVGSGGAGRFAGGEGLERHYRFLAPVSVSLLIAKTSPPRGLRGGNCAEPSNNVLVLGRRKMGIGVCTHSAGPGDTLRVQTPGGGGFGPQITDLTMCDGNSHQDLH
ncbi:MAG: hydantoinase B/oxoprolinase family protein [Phycisphaerales bacterium]|nr:hydantoinase B/oxoprolinase family protein [Phycisphaerales bacterium]